MFVVRKLYVLKFVTEKKTLTCYRALRCFLINWSQPENNCRCNQNYQFKMYWSSARVLSYNFYFTATNGLTKEQKKKMLQCQTSRYILICDIEHINQNGQYCSGGSSGRGGRSSGIIIGPEWREGVTRRKRRRGRSSVCLSVWRVHCRVLLLLL